MGFAFIFESVGGTEWFVLLGVVLIVVGPKNLPSAARKLGQVMANLRRAADEFKRQLMTMDQEVRKEVDNTISDTSTSSDAAGSASDASSETAATDEGGNPSNPTQLDHKLRLQRALPDVHGVTWWPGYTITENFKGVLDSLETNQMSRPALIPAYTWLDDTPPSAVNDVKVKKVNGKKHLVWNVRKSDDPMQQAVRFVIYRFPKGKKGSLDKADNILAITGETSLLLPDGDKGKWQYAVTALDRCWNESAPAWKK